MRCRRWSGSGSLASRSVAPVLGRASPDPGEDVSDHDELRHDPVLALFADQLEPKRPDCAPLAGKSTLNRLEPAPLRPDDR
jgi:hypothetical protein